MRDLFEEMEKDFKEFIKASEEFIEKRKGDNK